MQVIKNQAPYTFILTTWWKESHKLTYSQQHKAKHKSKLYGSPPSSNNISQQIADRFHIQVSSSSLGRFKQVLKEGYLTHTQKLVPIKHAKWQRTVGTRRFHHSHITNPIKTLTILHKLPHTHIHTYQEISQLGPYLVTVLRSHFHPTPSQLDTPPLSPYTLKTL